MTKIDVTNQKEVCANIMMLRTKIRLSDSLEQRNRFKAELVRMISILDNIVFSRIKAGLGRDYG